MNIHRLLSILYVLFMATTLNAQIVQSGYVKQYNGYLKKTPLNGVELYISNAGSTISDKKGRFVLQFRTSKPGDKVSCRRIEKLGYEIFNKEALEEWVISSDNTPFVIVMCKSSEMKSIRDSYSRITNRSYAEQQAKEKEEIENAFQKGLLLEADYIKKKNEIELYYQKQLEKIDAYIDRFVRLDLSEISSTERNIIRLFQNGDVEGAVTAYEQQHFLEAYVSEYMDIKRLQGDVSKLKTERKKLELSRDKLFNSIKNQIITYRLAGGRENFEKSNILYKECAYADTTNVSVMRSYASDMWEQKQYDESERAFAICVRYYSRIKSPFTFDMLDNLGAIYYAKGDFKKAQQCSHHAIEAFQKLYIPDTTYVYYKYISKFQSNLGLAYLDDNDVENAERYLLAADENTRSLYDYNPTEFSFMYATNLNNLADLYNRKSEYKKALDYMQQSHSLYKELFNRDDGYRMDYAMSLYNLASISRNLKDYDFALNYIKQAYLQYNLLYDKNTETYAFEMSRCLQCQGNIYLKIDSTELAVESFNKSEQIIQNQYARMPKSYKQELARDLVKVGIYYLNLKDFGKAEEKLWQAYCRYQDIRSYDKSDSYTYSILLWNLFNTFQKIEDQSDALIGKFDSVVTEAYEIFKAANTLQENKVDMDRFKEISQAYIFRLVLLDKIDEALEICTDVYKLYPKDIALYYAFALNALTYRRLKSNDDQSAIECINQAISIAPDYANLYDTKGEILLMQGKNEEALAMWKMVLELNPDFQKENPDGTELSNGLKKLRLIE